MSWWRKIAEELGATSGTGSWKRRVVLSLVTPAAGARGSWPQVLARTDPNYVKQAAGSGTRRISPTGVQGSSWARILASAGGPTN